MSNCIFESRTDTSSATICKHCGKEKFEHTIATITYTKVAMSKQTAVDYFVEQLFKTRNNTTEVKEMDINSIIDQAKQMEKEQMKEVYLTHCVKAERLRKIFEQQFDDYYNETYGGNNE